LEKWPAEGLVVCGKQINDYLRQHERA
jgi:hypothetical protein